MSKRGCAHYLIGNSRSNWSLAMEISPKVHGYLAFVSFLIIIVIIILLDPAVWEECLTCLNRTFCAVNDYFR